jgi:hypothetical protein
MQRQVWFQGEAFFSFWVIPGAPDISFLGRRRPISAELRARS